MYAIVGIDSEGTRWFYNKHGSWQENRDSDCHWYEMAVANARVAVARNADRFKSRVERMDTIEVVTL